MSAAAHTAFADRLEAAGHKLRRDEDGQIDNFVVSDGFHNGPGCDVCHSSWCEHCGGEIEPCDGGKWHAEYTLRKDAMEWARLVALYGNDGPPPAAISKARS